MWNIFIKLKYGSCLKPTYISELNKWAIGIQGSKYGYEVGDYSYIMGEYARMHLTYRYVFRGRLEHAHDFEHVCADVIKDGATFRIPEEYRTDYSEQEYEFLMRLKRRSKGENL